MTATPEPRPASRPDATAPRPDGRAPRRRWRHALAALLVLTAAGLGLASASTLAVTSTGTSARVVTAPCTGSAATTAAASVNAAAQSFSAVDVTLPAGCGTRAVQVTLLQGTTVVASGSGSITGNGAVGTGTYTAAAGLTVQLTADGWSLPATWEYSQYATCALTSGTGTCTATVTMFSGTRPGGTSAALYFDVWVTTTSTSWVPWQVTFDLAHTYYGTTVTRLGNSTLDGYGDGTTTWSSTGWVNDVHRVSHCSALPSLVVAGDQTSTNNNRNFAVVRSDRARYFSLVVNRTEAGYYDVLAPGCGAP